MTNINIRTEENIKKEAEQVFSELGLSMSVAINVFLRQAIRAQGMPFDMTLNTPNQVTIKAIEEGDKLVADKNRKSYKNIKDLRKSLGV